MEFFKKIKWFILQEKKKYIMGVLLIIVLDILNLVPSYVVRLIVDGIEMGNLEESAAVRWLAILLIATILIYLLKNISRYYILGGAAKLSKNLRNRLYKHFTKMSPKFFIKNRTGDLMARSTNDITSIEMAASQGSLTMVDTFTLGAMLVFSMMYFIDVSLTLIVLIPLPFMAISSKYLGKRMRKKFLEAQESFADLNNITIENISGIRVVKSFNSYDQELEKFKKTSQETLEKNLEAAKINALFAPTSALTVGVSVFISVALGSYYVFLDKITIGQLMQFNIYLAQLSWPILAFGFLYNMLERGNASYDRVQKILDTEPDFDESQGCFDEIHSGNLKVDIPEFYYPEGDVPALKNIDFEIKPGMTLGIVGETGAGKTTLIKTILRELEIENGSIEINDININDYKISCFREFFGYVPQDHILFSLSVRDNIAFGREDSSMEEVMESAQKAQIHEDILKFKKQYDTFIGERGVTISGGQKQRISIARALHVNPEILVLDDPLSSVDSRTERNILSELRKDRKNRTTIISAHRMSAVEEADLIIVLKDGEILEKGTHQELVENDGWYLATYNKQRIEGDKQ